MGIPHFITGRHHLWIESVMEKPASSATTPAWTSERDQRLVLHGHSQYMGLPPNHLLVMGCCIANYPAMGAPSVLETPILLWVAIHQCKPIHYVSGWTWDISIYIYIHIYIYTVYIPAYLRYNISDRIVINGTIMTIGCFHWQIHFNGWITMTSSPVTINDDFRLVRNKKKKTGDAR